MSNDAVLGTQFIRVLTDSSGLQAGFTAAEGAAQTSAGKMESAVAGMAANSKARLTELGDHVKSSMGGAADAVAHLFEHGLAPAIENAKSAESAIAGLGESLIHLAVPTALAGITAGLIEIAHHTIETIAQLELVSQKTGISTESLSKWDFAGKTVGLELTDISRAVGILSKQMIAGVDETGKASKALGMLGLSSKDTTGHLKSTEEMMFEVADRFAAMSDGAEKTAAAMQLFGRSGKDMIPLLNMGRDGLKELTDEAERFGYTVSEKTAKEAHEFEVSLKALQLAGAGAARGVVTDFLPALAMLGRALRDSSEQAKEDIYTYTALGVTWTSQDTGALVALGKGAELAGRAFVFLKVETQTLGAAWGAFIQEATVVAMTPPGANYFTLVKSQIAEIEKQYKATQTTIASRGLAVMDPNASKGIVELGERTKDLAAEKLKLAAATAAATHAQEIDILKLKLTIATDQDNRREMEMYSAALERIAHDDAVTGGANKTLADIQEDLTAKIRHATLAQKDKAEADKESGVNAKKAAQDAREFATELTRIQEAMKGAAVVVSGPIEAQREVNIRAQKALEDYVAASDKRMVKSKLTAADDKLAIELAASQEEFENQVRTEALRIKDATNFAELYNQIVAKATEERVARDQALNVQYGTSWQQALDRYTKSLGTMAQNMDTLWTSTMTNMERSSSDLFFDLLSGKIKSLGDVFKGLLTSMERDIADFLAKQATKRLLEMFVQWALNHNTSYQWGAVAGNAAVGAIPNIGGTSVLSSQSAAIGGISAQSVNSYFSGASATPIPPISANLAPRQDRTIIEVSMQDGLLANVVTRAASAGAELGYARVYDDLDRGGAVNKLILRRTRA